MPTIGRILVAIRNAALAPEPSPVYLASFLVISGALFVIAYQIGH